MTASRAVVIGADTHLDTVHLAALSPTGQQVADAQFPTRPAGYYLAVKWAQSFGVVLRAGVEGTSSYGAGLTRAMQDAGIEVAEINRSDRAARRRQGKSDPLDAYAAARAALAGHGLAVPKDQHTSALRALLTARRGAVKARTAAINQIKSLLITAPPELRERYRRHTTTTLIRALARCRPAAHDDPTTVAVLIGCKALAQRILFMEDQDRVVTAELDRLATAINPGLRAAYGVGPDTAAQLAANNALHRIALVRMSSDERTRTYVKLQLAKGRSKLDILRLLKRAIAREVFRLLTQPCTVEDYSDLRPARQAKNITLAAVADHFGVWPNDISRLERGLKRDDTLAINYRHWLNAA